MIVEQYVHTLIPRDAQFCPSPEQVRRFVDGLSELGAAPLDAEFKIAKPSGRLRSGTHPLTGEIITIPRKEIIAVDSSTNISRIVSTLDQYEVAMDGQGPPALPLSLYTMTRGLLTRAPTALSFCRSLLC